MKRREALKYVAIGIDAALSPRDLSDMPCDARLVGWQCGFEPMFVAVWSYLPGCKLDESEAIDLATDLLTERGWFADGPTEPDYVL